MTSSASMESQNISRRHAFSMAETVISIAIVGGLVVASLQTVGSATMAQGQMGNSGRGYMLAHDLMTEILQQGYEEPVDTAIMGREGSESGGDRDLYDDIDDYNSWSSAPEEKDGTEITNLTDWTRSVAVTWVNTSDTKTFAGSETGLKRITVTVKYKGEIAAVLSALRAGSKQSTRTGYIPPLGDRVIEIVYGELQ